MADEKTPEPGEPGADTAAQATYSSIVFTDPKGRDWHPRFTLGALRRLEHHLGVPVFSAKGSDNLMGADTARAGLFYCCSQEIKERKLTFEAWNDLLDDADASYVLETWTSFFGASFRAMLGKSPFPAPASPSEAGNTSGT